MAKNGFYRMVRKMGYIADQEGIINRYLREKEHWENHLNNTKAFISNAFHEKGVKSVAVMGSGWLLDLPLKKLSERFEKVLLLDIHHPPQAVKKAEKYKNVVLQEADLSGGAMKFCWKMRKQKDEYFSNYILDHFEPEKPKLEFKPDAFISLNILNQLDILIVDFMKKRLTSFLPEEYQRFRNLLQQFHIDWISKKPGCLVSDVTEIIESENGEISHRDLVYIKLPESKRSEEWTWDFDLSGTYQPGQATRFLVKALEW